MDQLNLESDKGTIVLGPNTLVFALDDTGNEAFKDPNHPVFGIGGCGFMARDYVRLIDAPWDYLCKTYFTDFDRPLHASDIQFTKEQIEGVAHFFKSFEFFRVASTANSNLVNDTELDVINLIGNALLNRISEVGQWAEFDRIFIIFEASDRIEAKVMMSLANKIIIRESKEIKLELAIIPKSSCMSAMEVADFIAHTSGAQARTMEHGKKGERKDFNLVFSSISKNLTSFMHLTKAKYTSA